ncbi:unnamed protein product [Lactuca virosa]|uniref:Gnk2-homologous domain-containing protein n=1 Tax=Lactuca virosa TaxID=75947 RepID=A0AAU9NEB2_9ASTR|nr:unnamed protein product [Lactuca virosa]
MTELVVLVILLIMSNLGTSQSNNNSTNTTNTPIRLSCGINPVTSSSSIFSSLDSTITELRSQLWNKDVYFARAHDLRSLDLVYGLAQCRNYLSAAQCVACFDAAVSAIKTCSSVTGAYVFLDNCFLRFENYPEFYEDPQAKMDVKIAPTLICGNQLASQTTIFNQIVGELLSDIQVATPRTSNFYVASTKRLPSGNTTIYAIAQCVESVTQPICEQCMNISYNNLNSCPPSKEGRTLDFGCFLRYSQTPFFQDNQTTNIVHFLSKGSSRKLGMIIGASVGVGIILLIIASSLWYKLRKKPKIDEGKHELERVKAYKYTDLRSATHNFKEEYKIGKGGYGEVFKAVLDNENVVAVKKLHDGDGPQVLLVLEYMPQGSLDKFLWGEKRGTLNWRQRFDIMVGIARDFGLARDQPEDQSHVSTLFAGTLGYTAPEYATHGQLSEKVDTYSFGIVALEIISGRRGTAVNLDPHGNNYLLEHAWELYESGMHIELVDKALDPNEYEEEDMMNMIEIALLCTQSPANLRPIMSEVVLMLSSGGSFRRLQMTRPTVIHHNRRIHVDAKGLQKM